MGTGPQQWDVCRERTELRRGTEPHLWFQRSTPAAHREGPAVSRVPSLRDPELKLLFEFNAMLCFISFVLLSPK